MKAIVEALIAATNLAALVSNETLCKDLRTSADKTLDKLYTAIDRVVELRAQGAGCTGKQE